MSTFDKFKERVQRGAAWTVGQSRHTHTPMMKGMRYGTLEPDSSPLKRRLCGAFGSVLCHHVCLGGALRTTTPSVLGASQRSETGRASTGTRAQFERPGGVEHHHRHPGAPSGIRHVVSTEYVVMIQGRFVRHAEDHKGNQYQVRIGQSVSLPGIATRCTVHTQQQPCFECVSSIVSGHVTPEAPHHQQWQVMEENVHAPQYVPFELVDCTPLQGYADPPWMYVGYVRTGDRNNQRQQPRVNTVGEHTVDHQDPAGEEPAACVHQFVHRLFFLDSTPLLTLTTKTIPMLTRSKARALVDMGRDPTASCNPDHHRFHLYDKHAPIPKGVRNTIEREFRRDRRNAPHGLCRGALPMSYLLGALAAADIIAVGSSGPHITSVILALEPTFISPVTQKPICKPHELYMDVVCSFYRYRLCGAATIDQFMQHARRRGVRALRIYATQASRPISQTVAPTKGWWEGLRLWRQKWGFREAETVVRADGRCVYGRHAPLS